MASLNTPFLRFFVASLSLHLLLLLLWGNPPMRARPQEAIAVSLLPPTPLEEPRGNPAPAPREASRGPSKTPPGKIAKKNSPPRRQSIPVPKQKAVAPQELASLKEPTRKEPTREETPPPRREQIPDKAIVTQKPLPTLKQLLPPMGWSPDGSAGGASAPIRLDTSDPQYVTYFNSIKRAIEIVWQYPELALRYGLQGRLLLEFSVLGNGDIESAKIIRSSGSNLLDEEALRAVKAAAPFGPIPSWLGKNRIDIVASFEYLDNRLNYRFMR